MGGVAPPGPSSQQKELNNRLDNALEQIENVSRQLCSVQDPNPVKQPGFGQVWRPLLKIHFRYFFLDFEILFRHDKFHRRPLALTLWT